ncbi:MAG: hypothetical protein HQL10_00030 [Nitrospirae bacterium]|nr:hypothetical protein [Nitrospirota bacterium]
MRIWSIHPKYLDSKGIVALWRETLLAQAVLTGKTKGYVNHPQLRRFKENKDPIGSIGKYLNIVLIESENRGYKFSGDKIIRINHGAIISVCDKQVQYEFSHLLKKLRTRDIKKYDQIQGTSNILVHDIFQVIPCNIESWEVV